MDYQSRYLAHQKRKKESLQGKYEKEKSYSAKEVKIVKEVFKNRNSSRVFNGEGVDLKEILEMVETSPSSCDRKGVSYKVIEERADKDLLSGLLVGGVGWVNRADKIILLYSDMEAYKSPAEKDFMPYLDAGVMIQSFYLACEVLGVKVCYVNPNIRPQDKDFFDSRFFKEIWGTEYKYLGAIVLGK
jgi:nitroreductase